MLSLKKFQIKSINKIQVQKGGKRERLKGILELQDMHYRALIRV
jgi:hypothetical protein